jgi:hypothetical protein
MKWQRKAPLSEQLGKTRKRNKFLWWPRQVGNETWWLTWALIVEMAVWYDGFDGIAYTWEIKEYHPLEVKNDRSNK